MQKLQTILSSMTQMHNFSIVVTCSSFYRNSSPGDATDTSRNHPLNDQVYYSEATPTQRNYSYNTVSMDTEGLNTYDVIGQTQQKTNTQDTPATPAPVREEARKGDDFYVTEEHTYSAVNKKKKMSEDGEGGGTKVKRV